MSNKVYDFLKKLVQVMLPAAGTLYFTLASIWGLPAAEQVVGSIVAVTLFLGTCLGISSKKFNETHDVTGSTGDMVITEKEDGGLTYLFELNDDPLDLITKNLITFNVIKKSEDAG